MTIQEQAIKIRTEGFRDAMINWPGDETEAPSWDDVLTELVNDGTIAQVLSDAQEWCDKSIAISMEYIEGFHNALEKHAELCREYIAFIANETKSGEIGIVGIYESDEGYTVYEHRYTLDNCNIHAGRAVEFTQYRDHAELIMRNTARNLWGKQ